jgi:hypothetical protein
VHQCDPCCAFQLAGAYLPALVLPSSYFLSVVYCWCSDTFSSSSQWIQHRSERYPEETHFVIDYFSSFIIGSQEGVCGNANCEHSLLLGPDTCPVLKRNSAHARVLSTCVRYLRIGFRRALYTPEMCLPAALYDQDLIAPCPSCYAKVCAPSLYADVSTATERPTAFTVDHGAVDHGEPHPRYLP